MCHRRALSRSRCKEIYSGFRLPKKSPSCRVQRSSSAGRAFFRQEQKLRADRLLQQRPEHLPYVVSQDFLTGGIGVHAIGKVEFAAAQDSL